MTGDRQEDWPERQAPRHSGRHSRVSREDNGTDPRVVPGRYGPPDPRRPYVAPDQHAPQDPYAYGRPDPYAAPDAYAAPDQHAPQDPYAYGRPDPYAAPDAYTTPDAYSGPDGYAAPGAYPAAGAYAAPDAHAAPDGYAAPGAYHPADGQTPTDAYALTDRYSVPGPAVRPNPPHPPQAYRQPGYPGQEPFGPAGDPRDTRGGLAGLPEQNGYGRPDAHGQSPPRWPSPGATGPQGLTGAPGRGGGTDREPQPGSRDWDPGPGQDWDAGQESGGFASLRRSQDTSPRPQPPTGPRPARPGPRPQAGPPQRDGPASPAGLIPGFWDGSDSRRSRPRRPMRRVGWVLAPLLALALLCALAVAGYDVYKGFQSKDFTGPGFGHVTVQVLPGDTATSLAPRLVQLGVVASTKSFISAAKQNSNPAGLEPGFFALHKHMNSALAYQMLLNPASRIQSKAAIPEGLRESAILSALEKKYPNIPASAFTAAAKDAAALGLPAYADGNPEGYLFPATYNFNPGTSALGMLQAMVARFNQEATTIDLPVAAKAAHLTPGQVITVASILEAEAGNPKYYRQVAEVIYNRLNIGMKLGLDSTVNYALHRFGVHLTTAQLHVNSPYNTFIHTGLPPGPIDSPGDAAIQAALHPDHGNLLYFVTVNLKTGLTKFTSSNAQFQQFVAECQHNNAC